MLSEIAPAKPPRHPRLHLQRHLTASYLLPTLCGSWAINNFSLDVAWRVPFIVAGSHRHDLFPAPRLPESPALADAARTP